MKKLIFGTLIFFVVAFTIAWLIAKNNKLKFAVSIMTEVAMDYSRKCDTLQTRIDSLLEDAGAQEVIYHARDFKTKDFFTFVKIGRGWKGYEMITDLPDIDRTAFDFIYWTCVDSGVDIPFLMHVLWSESRMGTNTKHAKNKDGSIDGGWFGINYKKGVAPLNRTAYTDVFDFIKKYRILENYPRKEWASRYNSKVLWIK